MSDAEDDLASIARCLRGDPSAFEPLVARYERVVFAIALRLLGDYEDARDATQDAFVRAYEKLHTFDPTRRFFSVAVRPRGFSFDVGPETLARTTLGRLRVGTRVNLERPLRFGAAVGGHLVLGHVDGVATVESVTRVESTARVRIALGDPALAPLLIPQGSVAVEGVSLTVAALAGTTFEVMLIPHTLAATTLDALAAGQAVNIETDVIGKYVVRSLALRGTT